MRESKREREKRNNAMSCERLRESAREKERERDGLTISWLRIVIGEGQGRVTSCVTGTKVA